MIIFGRSGEKLINQVPLSGASCPSCSVTESLFVVGFIRYAHVWYIPFVPGGKRTIVVCSHCQYAMQGREIPVNVASQVQQYREELKYPWYYWIGLMIMVCFFLVIILLIYFASYEI